jgi:hypothetical protein
MAKTLSDLEYGVRVFLDEANAADFKDTEVVRSINYGYHDLVSKIITVYENFYETTSPFQYALVANQQEYAIDSTLIKVTRVEVNYAPNQSGSTPLRAIPVKMDEDLLNLSNSASSGSIFNAGYYLHGNISAQKIGLIPMPTVSDTTGKSLSVWGIALPVDLVNGTDSPIIPYVDNFGQLIELKAAQILMSKGQENESVAGEYLQMYASGVEQMFNFLRDRQADGVQMIQDIEIDNLDFQTLPPF